jgi:hypothetical protein
VTALEQPSPHAIASGDLAFGRDSVERALLDAAVRTVGGRNCADLDRMPLLGRHAAVPGPIRSGALVGEAWADAVAVDAGETVDADAVATWIAERYPAASYPAVVLGSPHGSAIHLAAALGAAWLPTAFPVNVRWPDGAAWDWDGALDYGMAVCDKILEADPSVTVRQVHDPVRSGSLCGATLTLYVRWRRLPEAYRAFLRHRLEPGGGVLLLRDARTWPVLSVHPRHTFQIGSPVSGWEPEEYSADQAAFRVLLRRLGGEAWVPPHPDLPRRYAELAGDVGLEAELRGATTNTHRVLYPDPHALSASVADLYLDWMRQNGRSGDHLVVETERLVDPWLVLTEGLVPYWCEASSSSAVAGAESWVAGSPPFDFMDVLPQPPGTDCAAFAIPAQWKAVAWFARRYGRVNRDAARRYPLLPLPTCHVAEVLASRATAPSAPPRMRMAEALAGLRRAGEPLGVLVM